MTQQQINVHYLPSEVGESELEGSAVAVIDVLRATSTICQALASGAREVVPFVEIDEALAAAERAGRPNVVLGGERKGLLIDGFDLGNSPAEYSVSRVGGRAVYVTTTNGTRALRHARLAKRVVAASFLNLSAVVASFENEPRVDILCAGTDGTNTSEDILLAGAIVSRLVECDSRQAVLNKRAEAARLAWQQVVDATGRGEGSMEQIVTDRLNVSLGGQNCIEVGNGGDIPYCSQVDLLRVLPTLNMREWKIIAA
ncbi:MAG TPA: 2-phosphosulfolactate phosphatase [Pirellulaceae bacterium]|jgi:2-phosphosulfolactate phosphatase